MNKYLEKIAEKVEYAGPGYGTVAGLAGAGMIGGSALGLSGLNAMERGVGGGKRLAIGAGLAGAGTMIGLLGAPAVAASRAGQDAFRETREGDNTPHYLRSALIGGVAGGLAPTRHLGIGRGALLGLGASAGNQVYQAYKQRPNSDV